jgi:hypothetical protein
MTELDDVLSRIAENSPPDFVLELANVIYEGTGDKGILLFALSSCCDYGLPIPAWLAQAFSDAYQLYLSGEAKSLDKIFGNRKFVAHGRRIKEQRKVRQHIEGKPLSRDGGFSTVPGVDASKAEKLYYESQKFLERLKKL